MNFICDFLETRNEEDRKMLVVKNIVCSEIFSFFILFFSCLKMTFYILITKD